MTLSQKPSEAVKLTYSTHGIGLMGAVELFPYSTAIDAAKMSTHRRDKTTGGAAGGYGMERQFHDAICDGDELYRISPHLFELYLRGHDTAQQLLPSRTINFSPWRKSSMTLKDYTQPGDQHGWHVETNGLTIILMLRGSGRLDIMDGPQPPHPDHEGDFHCEMREGQMWLLRGHDVWHRVPPLRPDDLPRTSLVMNYYIDDDFSRPEGIDGQHYA